MNGSSMNGGTSPAEYPVRDYRYPETKADLADLLKEYQVLLQNTADARAAHESDYDAKSFVDPSAENKSRIERILYDINETYAQHLAESEALLRDLADVQFDHGLAQLDLRLLQDQITSLQLLAKDVDLPENLQRRLSTAATAADGASDSADSLLRDLFDSPKEYSSYLDKARSLGIALSPTVSSLNPLHAKLGNYYTENIISSKISSRINDLEDLPLNVGTFSADDSSTNIDDLKVKSLIELKALKLLSKQKQLKKFIINYQANEAHLKVDSLAKNPIINQATRSYYVRNKIYQPHPELLAHKLEEKQKLELERKKHMLHVEKIRMILEYSRELIDNRLGRINKRASIVKSINAFHSFIEKDESKKLERTAKQRLQALKANDEEAYMKLLDETKDHRITHLLKQTNQFLDTLAQAVKVQQVEQGAEDIPLEEGTVENLDNVDELREKIDYYQVAHRIKEDVKEQPKILVGGQLKEYQIKGLQWMVSLYNNKLNGILADEMGLGKTIQSISLVTYLIEKKHEDKFLIIVPLSTITNWTMEFEKWAPTVRTIVYKGSQQQRRLLQPEVRLGNFQVLLTTYEYIIRERPVLSKFEYSHMIIDEGHRMKNSESKLSVTLRTYYKTKNRLILTGTPLQNNLPELWALLNFVLPKIFNSVKSFDEWFNTPFANTGSQEKIELTEEESLLVIRRLHKVLRPFLLRRLKKDVEKDLPDKVEKVLKCNLSGLQYILYQQMLKHNALFVGAEVGSSKSGIKGLNNKIMQLRKICNHPFVFEEVEAVLDSSRLTNDLIWRTSGKFELLDRILPKFKTTGHRVLMFFQMTQVMDIMEDFLRWRDMKYLRLDGSTKAEDRQTMLKVFNAPNSEYFCFLLSTRAGGLGLNLQTADTVIIFDTDWNPHQDLQAQDRAHRIGQKNEVRILRLITNDSVEEVILERAHQKLDIDGKVIQAGKFDNKSTSEEQEEFLKRLLEAENSRDEDNENNMLEDEELNEILARSEEEKVLFNKMDVERLTDEKLHAPYKVRLIEQSELPPVFTEDVSHHFEKDTKELTRMRAKKKVKYDDGLTEEQWAMAIDDDNDSVEAAIRRKEARSRRKRTSHDGSDDDIDDVDEDDDELVSSGRRKRTRRSTTPNGYLEKLLSDEEEEDEVFEEAAEEEEPEPEESSNPIIAEGLRIINGLHELKAEDGHQVTEVFLTLPSRKLYPDYFKVISKPISVNQIVKKLNRNTYVDLDEFKQDVLLMCSNAKTYNEEGSWIYADAELIEKHINSL